MSQAIWKDRYVILGEGYDTSYEYRIMLGDAVIYTGNAYARPGEFYATARINEVCADYMEHIRPEFQQASFADLSVLTFTIQVYTWNTPTSSWYWNTVSSVEFVADWSYDYDHDIATDGMACPIDGRIAATQPVVYSAYDTDEVDVVVTDTSGTSYTVVVSLTRTADFSDDFNEDFSLDSSTVGSATVYFDPSAYDNVDYITIGDTVYTVADTCARYALYYVNAYGGWDTFLVDGMVKEHDALTRYTTDVEYDNRYIVNRGRRNYANEVAKGWTMTTGWLSDDSASRMHHLLNSTDVYLYDIEEGTMTPVVLTDTATDYKTYKGEGCKPVRYTIEAAEAHARVRR